MLKVSYTSSGVNRVTVALRFGGRTTRPRCASAVSTSRAVDRDIWNSSQISCSLIRLPGLMARLAMRSAIARTAGSTSCRSRPLSGVTLFGVDPLPARPGVRPRGATLSGLRRVRSDANAISPNGLQLGVSGI